MESRASNADLVHTQKRPMWPPGASCTQRVVSESACLLKPGVHHVIYMEQRWRARSMPPTACRTQHGKCEIRHADMSTVCNGVYGCSISSG